MRRVALASLLLSLASCQQESRQAPKKDPSNSSAGSAPATSPSLVDLEPSVLWALARSSQAKDLSHLRRLLTLSPPARPWATLGLGLHCNDSKESDSLHFLVNGLAAWVSESQEPEASVLHTMGWAIGACASEEAEEVLRSWLSPDPSAQLETLIDAGVLGLASLVDRRGALSERTQTALLDAARREGRAEILLPLGRLDRLSEAVGAHMLEVAGALLTSKRSIGRRQAIFALGSAGPSATAPLSQVLLAQGFSPQERAAAAQALGRLGPPGQEALDKTLGKLLERGLPTSFDRDLWIPLRAGLSTLQSSHHSKKQLSELRGVVLSEGRGKGKAAQRRRMVWLRCRSADLLAGDRYESAALLKCDPDSGRQASLARLRVIARGPLTTKRLKAFLAYTKDLDPVVVQAALRLIPSHSELEAAAELLLKALQSDASGTQATAAQIITAYPTRVFSQSEEAGPSEAILKALSALLEDNDPPVPTETRAAAIQAAGALQALSLKSLIEEICKTGSSALQIPAERALALLNSPESRCTQSQSEKEGEVAPEKASPRVTLRIDSDVGELLLHVDNPSAPASVAHFLRLVDDGFYNGLAIHGSRPGFAVQFGDKDGDGYDESFSETLPHEVSPTPFNALSFGMSAFSPGSQNSQIFVVVSDAPQLMATRVHLGTAEGPWHLLTVGDVFHAVKRDEPPSKTKK